MLATAARAQIREDPQTGVYVAGVTEEFVTDYAELLGAMAAYLSRNAGAALALWLAPIVPSALLPLRYTSVPLAAAAALSAAVMLGALLSPRERERAGALAQLEAQPGEAVGVAGG